ncbi:hypothetical protein U1Q18_051310 [Sarracenia purpurea var. burkii]
MLIYEHYLSTYVFQTGFRRFLFEQLTSRKQNGGEMCESGCYGNEEPIVAFVEDEFDYNFTMEKDEIVRRGVVDDRTCFSFGVKWAARRVYCTNAQMNIFFSTAAGIFSNMKRVRIADVDAVCTSATSASPPERLNQPTSNRSARVWGL